MIFEPHEFCQVNQYHVYPVIQWLYFLINHYISYNVSEEVRVNKEQVM